MWINLLIILFAGWGAGIVTGLVGASAVVIVTPILVNFLGYSPYTAIGISLATDVIASSISAYTYHQHGNTDIKNGIYMTAAAVIAALVGSKISGQMSDSLLGGSTNIVILFLGISFLRKPIHQRIEDFKEKFDLSFWRKRKLFSSLFFGSLIGMMCGIVGAGGGMIILIILTFVLGYSVHIAIGTSVLIMTFTALSGSIGHFIIEASIPYLEVGISCTGALIGALMAANYANLVSEAKLSKLVGVAFIFLGLISIA
ncbi:MAG: sulfite exporter TauE/SafE family protein [Bacillota bacterium]